MKKGSKMSPQALANVRAAFAKRDHSVLSARSKSQWDEPGSTIRAARVAGFAGHKHTPESKAKMAAALERYYKQRSESGLSHHTPEVKARISAAMKAYHAKLRGTKTTESKPA
jgi:hypothetical protein